MKNIAFAYRSSTVQLHFFVFYIQLLVFCILALFLCGKRRQISRELNFWWRLSYAMTLWHPAVTMNLVFGPPFTPLSLSAICVPYTFKPWRLLSRSTYQVDNRSDIKCNNTSSLTHPSACASLVTRVPPTTYCVSGIRDDYFVRNAI